MLHKLTIYILTHINTTLCQWQIRLSGHLIFLLSRSSLVNAVSCIMVRDADPLVRTGSNPAIDLVPFLEFTTLILTITSQLCMPLHQAQDRSAWHDLRATWTTTVTISTTNSFDFCLKGQYLLPSYCQSPNLNICQLLEQNYSQTRCCHVLQKTANVFGLIKQNS